MNVDGGGAALEAMILAAGEGLRLRPLTETVPKALVEVAGRTALERVADALVGAGVTHLVVNAHHFADRVEAAARGLETERLRVSVSREDESSDIPLETGGGLAFARSLLTAQRAFFLHNADVLTDLPLADVHRAHERGAAHDGRLATLVVTRRETSRPLLVDDVGVCGRINRTEGWEVVCRHPLGDAHEVGFAGIHVLSPEILRHFRQTGPYSIIDVYVRLISAGRVIAIFDATDYAWHDIGTAERLERARLAFGVEEGS